MSLGFELVCVVQKNSMPPYILRFSIWVTFTVLRESDFRVEEGAWFRGWDVGLMGVGFEPSRGRRNGRGARTLQPGYYGSGLRVEGLGKSCGQVLGLRAEG